MGTASTAQHPSVRRPPPPQLTPSLSALPAVCHGVPHAGGDARWESRLEYHKRKIHIDRPHRPPLLRQPIAAHTLAAGAESSGGGRPAQSFNNVFRLALPPARLRSTGMRGDGRRRSMSAVLGVKKLSGEDQARRIAGKLSVPMHMSAAAAAASSTFLGPRAAARRRHRCEVPHQPRRPAARPPPSVSSRRRQDAAAIHPPFLAPPGPRGVLAFNNPAAGPLASLQPPLHATRGHTNTA